MELKIVPESDYQNRMDNEVIPFLKSCQHCGFFAPNDEGELYYERYRQKEAKGVIVMLHGFSESAEKYLEMIYYFLQSGYQVYIMDLRGHGRSARSQADLSLVHIERYEQYLTDLKCLVEKVVMPENEGLPKLLYAHSMGGGIGAAFLKQNPEIFRRAVLSSPMIRPLTGGIPIAITKGIAEIQITLGKGTHYVPGHHPFRGDETFESSAAASAERYAYYAQKRQQEEKFQTSGASYSWLREAARLSSYILKKRNWEKFCWPIVVFQAEQDDYVDKAAQKLFVRRLNQVSAHTARLAPMPGTKHEIYMSSDEVMEQYMNEIVNFFDAL